MDLRRHFPNHALCASGRPTAGRRSVFGALALCLAVVTPVIGCGSDMGGRDVNGGGPGGKADDPDDAAESEGDDGATEATAHSENVQVCEGAAERLREHTNSKRYEALRDVEQERVDCLIDANDATLGVIGETLKDVDSAAASQVEDVFKQPRSTATGLCNALVEASDVALEKSASVEHTACVGQAELHIAHAIDAHADLGAVPEMIKPARDAYPECYSTFDSETAGEITVDQETKAIENLSGCINSAVRDHRMELADRILTNFPGRNADTLIAELGSYFDRAQTSADQACTVLGAAGTRAGQAEVSIDVANCSVSMAILGGELLGTVITALAPDPSEDPDPMDEPGDGGSSSTSSG